MNSTVLAAGGIGCRPPFTAAQWQELEHQALIYKYLTAGVPVPPELLIPIQRSFEALPGQYYHHPARYCSYYGKKLDPEPGRCRRTDGKKWRCSKDAHPDSKYCERHMHRGRNRSRKPVESHSSAQLPSSSSTATSPSPSGSSSKVSIGGGFQSTQHSQSLRLGASSSLQLPLEPAPIGNRYFSGVKPSVDGHTFSEMSGTAKGLGMNFMERSWQTMLPRPPPSFTLSRPGDSSTLQSAYLQLSSAQELGHVTVSSVSRPQQQQHSFNWGEFDSVAPAKHEGQFLRAFFDERPRPMDSWSGLEEERSNRMGMAFPKTQLSMSFPLASADYSFTCSKSPNSEPVSTVTLMPEM